MNEEQKKQYKERYATAKQHGVKFWPDIIFKDLLVAFMLFVVLVLLATFIGVAQEPKADPADSAYIPRPEWYFLFLFQMLKYFPGSIEWIGTTIIPGIAVLALFLLPFFDRNPRRHWKGRKIAISVMSVIVVGIIGLTILAAVTTPPQVESSTVAGTLSEQILSGQDLYSVHCAECHGVEGEGGEVKGVEGFDGVILEPLASPDVMYVFTDEALANVISYGQQDSDPAMTPFGRAYGGELGPGDIEAIATFMRYTWDDRSEMPLDVLTASAMPSLAEGEVPSYEVHISAIVRRYCISCHREGKNNQNYMMTTYDEIINTGDNKPNLIAGDLTCNTMQMLNRVEGLEVGNPMPPTKELKPELVAIWRAWILAGMPNTAEDAAALTATTETPTPAP
jgi:menaquinol-cytochrome c reductase cytochrome b/c subunit